MKKTIFLLLLAFCVTLQAYDKVDVVDPTVVQQLEMTESNQNSGGELVETTNLANSEPGQSAKPSSFISRATDSMDQFIGQVTKFLFAVIMFDITFGLLGTSIPLVVVTLMFGAVFFTFKYELITFKLFTHGIQVVRGKFDKEGEQGEVNHFKALTSALSATVGLGNIAGVAIAVHQGGPGAVFWMVLAAFFGMASKFSSCTLAQKYRVINSDGSFSGGPMYYLEMGLKERGFVKLGSIFAVAYALMIIGGAIGGGNMFQGNQAWGALQQDFLGGSEDPKAAWVFGIILASLVGMVIIGGIKRIGKATEFIVPFMCGLYVLVSLYIIGSNASQIIPSLKSIVSMAFTQNAAFGGFLGVLIMGVRRAAFSNEAGVGSAAVVHAAAKNEEPVMEGVVAMLGPFIDTVIICLMTALVIIITDVSALYPADYSKGALMTAKAWGSAGAYMPKVLTVCIVLFAFSTMISWCYYGERGWIYLVDRFIGKGKGIQSLIIYRALFVFCVFFGVVVNAGAVLDFSDAMILGMAFPNIIGMIILSGKVKGWAKDYMNKLKSGEIAPTK
ncbi:alanine/glycine:cation symporter family protein [Lentisphaera marina]|uniref:alanine/glycine:cation symporter family protein n=1 Tax=Lentisphaera marina TaxID=1111041 RepID=UPI002365AE0C|nr:alanine/glycine:cation symporter family protein [Lentisphaera marina]MDD7986948.1 alanine/glycine:cation symporter family protein [Lentisphaera marina]